MSNISRIIAISLIIPIYNTEKYIKKCLNTVFNQTFEDIEYILINDNTPDNSVKIAQQIIEDHPSKYIRFIHNEKNRGSAGVRNMGIEAAKGKYIIFIDSDDYVEPTMLEDMYNQAVNHNADIVISDYYINYLQKQIYKKQLAPDNGKECAKWIMSGKLHSSNSNKLIKRDLYITNNIRFIEGINMWEDMSTIPRVCFFAKKVAYLPHAYLHYVQYNTNSYTSNITEKSIKDINIAIQILQDFFATKIEYQKSLAFLKIKAKIDFIMHSKNDERRKLCKLYSESNRLIIEHPSISLFYKMLLLLEGSNQFYLINVFSYFYFCIKKVLLNTNK